jgi:hypothetical protein
MTKGAKEIGLGPGSHNFRSDDTRLNIQDDRWTCWTTDVTSRSDAAPSHIRTRSFILPSIQRRRSRFPWPNFIYGSPGIVLIYIGNTGVAFSLNTATLFSYTNSPVGLQLLLLKQNFSR